MTAFDMWPFTEVRTVERRGELQILAGMSPDGLPVTITRLAPDTARDASLRRRFKDAIEAATRQAGADDPPILWADPSTLVPWAATYDDPDHRGADLIEGIFVAAESAASGGVTSHETMVQQSEGEKSVPALDPNSFPDYDTSPPQYQTSRPVYDTPRPVEHATPRPDASGPGGPSSPVPPSGGGDSGSRGSRIPLYVGLGVGGLVVVLLLGSVIALGATRDRDTSGDPGQVPTSQASASSSHANQITTAPAKAKSASPKSSPSDAGKPKLKKRKSVSVYGPTWKKADKTFLMSFKQLGWAFQAPGDFDCFVREHTDRKTKVLCFKIGAPKNKTRRVIIVDRFCSGKSCSKKERKKVERDPWNRKVHHYKKKDKQTLYVTGTFKNTKNHKKYFGFELSHYYKDGKGHLRRHVQVWADAPYKSKYATQIEKTVNSIRTQTG